MMPSMNGYEVCLQLKADERTREIPVIFITGLTEMEDKLQGFEVGGVDYITKPFQTDEVIARVKTHLLNRKFYQQFQEESARFQALAEATFEGIAMHENGVIIEVNHAVENIFGYQRAELIGKNALELFTPASQESLREHLLVKSDYPYEAAGMKKNGTIFPVEIQAKPIRYQGRHVMIVALQDNTWRRTLEQENRALHVSLSNRDHFGTLVGKSPVIQKVYDRIVRAAASDDPIIIYGETGTGKEVAARTIFELSEQHTKAFIAVNCGAIQESLFEPQFFGYRKGAFTGADRDTPGYFDQAQEGTLFLDEVGELTLLMQAKLKKYDDWDNRTEWKGNEAAAKVIM